MIPSLWLFGAGVAWATCQANELERFEASQLHMGTKFTIVLYAPCEELANQGFRSAFDRIAVLDRCLSDYDGDSELSRLSQTAPHAHPVPVSDDLLAVLLKAQEISRVQPGRFRRDGRTAHSAVATDPAATDAADSRSTGRRASAVGYQHLELAPPSRAARLTRKHMRLDVEGSPRDTRWTRP